MSGLPFSLRAQIFSVAGLMAIWVSSKTKQLYQTLMKQGVGTTARNRAAPLKAGETAYRRVLVPDTVFRSLIGAY